jgi:hypothetical protein
MPLSSTEIAGSFVASLERAARFAEPFEHFFAEALFPAAVADELTRLPIAAPLTETLSGKREYYNSSRCFVDAAAMARFPILAVVAEALQSRPVAQAISAMLQVELAHTFLRVEYAVDRDGFWLEPHTDLGVKKFTCLIYLADIENQSCLGTDIYSRDNIIYKRLPFLRNTALMFVPAENTWHGFAKRPMKGDRRSLILNYVTAEWRDRGQLAFPAIPVL